MVFSLSQFFISSRKTNIIKGTKIENNISQNTSKGTKSSGITIENHQGSSHTAIVAIQI